jgi:CO/xanthine dehydrogenase Mo-binding subunit
MTVTGELLVVGKSPRRIEGIEKVTGRAKFTGDLEIPGMLEGLVLRSPYPHALIESIDVSKAISLPGVIGVLTREDVKDINPYYGHCLRDRPLIALDRVLYVGEPVAAVAAETKMIAEEALSLIEVKYTPLPILATVDDALAPGAPVLHEHVQGVGEFHELKSVESCEKSNICHHERIEAGDVERGFAESDEVFDDVFEFPMIYHYTMEPHTGIAQVDSDFITLWTSSAHPFLIRSEIAQMFGYPLSQVSVVVPYVGGAYGGKSYFKIEPLVVALARKAGRPVRIEQTVPESMLTIRRHSARCRIRTGVKRDGTLIAREAEILLDTGAYADNGPRVAKRAAIRVHGPYRIPHYKIDVLAVYTNTVPAGSMRSIGGPQAIWPLESQMDIIAERLGINPVELRVKNLVKRGEQLRAGVKPMDADLVMGLNKAASLIGWNEPSKKSKKNVGIAVGVSDSEASPVSTSIVRLLSDGSIILLAGSTEVGQGVRTVLCQIVAEDLNTSLAKVNMPATDTMYTPFDRSTGASRSTTVMGTAVKAAALDLRRQLVEIGAELLKVDSSSIVLKGGKITSDGQELEYGKAVARFFGMAGGELIGRGYVRAGGGIDPITPIFWETGMGAAEVEVDVETGQISLKRYVSIADVGKAINPRQCEAQDEGASMMGIGHTLFESLQFVNGQPLNPNLIDYRVPTFSDVPQAFETELIENGDGPGPYGAKGMGESGIVSVAPAIGNALARQYGIRIKSLPLTPENVWRALDQKIQLR